MYALVDCNNFYASCERVFRPDLKNIPIAVLSNNDGCIIARSAEVKALGYKMGDPFFKVKERLKKDGVKVFSSNYALYGDLSRRVMDCLRYFAPEVEVYSIDEAFVDVSGIGELEVFLLDLRAKILQWTGIPVSIGAARTKTLSKLINNIVKKQTPEIGVGIEPTSTPYLQEIEIEDIWGIGRRLSASLRLMGYGTAYQLAQADPRMMRQKFNVVVEKTVRELAGQPCFEFNEAPPHPQNINVSRGFKKSLTDFKDIAEFVSFYASRAAEKLRQKQVYATQITTYLRTSPFQETPYRNSQTMALGEAMQDSRILVKAAKMGLRQIYRPGLRYQKAGVMLTGLQYSHERQHSLFGQPEKLSLKSTKLMQAMDQVNARYGRESLRLASSGRNQKWAMARDYLSPSYSTNVKHLPRCS